MQTRTLGRSSLVSSSLAYGCWRIAGHGEVLEFTPERLENARRSVFAAYEHGYSLFDHADIYAHGLGEELFGHILKEVGGMRSQILIASKCGIVRGGVPDAQCPYRYDSSASHIIESCEASLRRLGVETIDLYLIHRPDFLGDPMEIAKAVSQLRDQGKIREFGASNFHCSQMNLLKKALAFPVVVNQVEISLMHLAAIKDGTLDQCMIEEITPMAWSPLGGGKLAGQEAISLNATDHGHRGRIRDKADHIARAHGVSRSAVLLAWLLKHPSGIVPIVGATQPEHIKQAAEGAGLTLSREEWYELMEAAYGQHLP